jgi:hypothetical protein
MSPKKNMLYSVTEYSKNALLAMTRIRDLPSIHRPLNPLDHSLCVHTKFHDTRTCRTRALSCSRPLSPLPECLPWLPLLVTACLSAQCAALFVSPAIFVSSVQSVSSVLSPLYVLSVLSLLPVLSVLSVSAVLFVLLSCLSYPSCLSCLFCLSCMSCLSCLVCLVYLFWLVCLVWLSSPPTY